MCVWGNAIRHVIERSQPEAWLKGDSLVAWWRNVLEALLQTPPSPSDGHLGKQARQLAAGCGVSRSGRWQAPFQMWEHSRCGPQGSGAAFVDVEGGKAATWPSWDRVALGTACGGSDRSCAGRARQLLREVDTPPKRSSITGVALQPWSRLPPRLPPRLPVILRPHGRK